jgi:hypothetical protein
LWRKKLICEIMNLGLVEILSLKTEGDPDPWLRTYSGLADRIPKCRHIIPFQRPLEKGVSDSPCDLTGLLPGITNKKA